MPATRRPTARAATLPARRARLDLGRVAPSGRSIVVGLAILAAAAAAYGAALRTSVFAVRTVEVRGGPPRVQAEVGRALAVEQGRSLLRVDAAELERRLADVADVESVSFDRAYPNTLRVFVLPERPVLVLRRGREAWLVSARGRVLRTLRDPRRSSLPRVWVKGAADVRVGDPLAPEAGGAAAAVLGPLAGLRFSGGIREVSSGPKELTLVLGRGLEVRLGDLGDLRLKLAIARRILATVPAGPAAGYVDVSVPERSVLDLSPKVEGAG